jgi:hypothetical protein
VIAQPNSTPRVDVIVPVHTPNRQIDRAVASIVDGGLTVGPDGDCRINVVCHNTEVGPVRDKVRAMSSAAVRYLHYADGIRSPAGPFNYGLAESTAPWVMIMGSDDTLEPDAIRQWLGRAEGTQADVLIAPEAHASGRSIRTPVLRRQRSQHLDPVADRLSYRTAPLGLIRRALVEQLDLHFPTSMANGSDQPVSARLWFSGLSIGYGRGLPRYIVHDDAENRVTFTLKDLRDDLLFATELVKDPWFSGLPEAARHALVTKLVRVHLFSHVGLRADALSWNAKQARQGAEILETLISQAPRSLRPLSLADRRLLEAIGEQVPEPETMAALCSARRRFSHPSTWVPRDMRYLLHREAPLRFMAASALV